MKKLLILVLVLMSTVVSGQTRPSALQLTHKDYVDVREFGAKGDGITDDTAAIQAAIDYIFDTATAPSRLYFPGVTLNGLALGYGYYRTTSTLILDAALHRKRLEIYGDGWRASRIIYKGTDYVDVIAASGTSTLESIKINNITIDGDTHARYAFYGSISIFTDISEVYFSGGTGFLYISNPQYGKITDCVFRDTSRNPPAGVPTDVWGEDSGLVYLGGAGLWEFTHNAFARCGADPAVGVVENILHIKNSTGVVKNIGFENTQLVNITVSGQPTRSVNYAVKCSGVISLDQLYFEAVDTNVALIKIYGTGEGVKIHDLYGWNPKSSYIVENNSESDIIVDKVFMSNAFFTALGRWNPTGGDNRNDITFTNAKIINGTVSATTASSDVDSVAVGNNKWFSGVADAFTGSYASTKFQTIPRVLGGYVIASGSDALGPTISVTAGKYLRSDGELVDSYWHSSTAPASLTNTLTLRFHSQAAVRQQQYYQVRVNAAGSAYMTASTSAILHTNAQLADPYQNIIAEFYLDESDTIGTITLDLARLYVGNPLGGERGAPLIFTTLGTLTGNPTLVPVATGSVYLYPTTNASFGLSLGMIAVEGGASPVWKEFGAITP